MKIFSFPWKPPPGHVPREERLHFAVALLLETQSFPLRGVDLECRLQRLLAVNGSTRLAQVWRLGVGDGLGMGWVGGGGLGMVRAMELGSYWWVKHLFRGWLKLIQGWNQLVEGVWDSHELVMFQMSNTSAEKWWDLWWDGGMMVGFWSSDLHEMNSWLCDFIHMDLLCWNRGPILGPGAPGLWCERRQGGLCGQRGSQELCRLVSGGKKTGVSLGETMI